MAGFGIFGRGISVASDSDVWTRNDVQAVSAIKINVNVKILFIYSFFLLIQFFENSISLISLAFAQVKIMPNMITKWNAVSQSLEAFLITSFL